MLFKGPWKVADHYLIVQRCQPFFFYECKEAQEKMVVWIWSQCLPIELYNKVFLNRIGMSLGKFLKMDRLIEFHLVLWEICQDMCWIGFGKVFRDTIYGRGHKINLEYEGLHLICFWCGKYGHKKDQCSYVVVMVEEV